MSPVETFLWIAFFFGLTLMAVGLGFLLMSKNISNR
jgi:hypothetical protein